MSSMKKVVVGVLLFLGLFILGGIEGEAGPAAPIDETFKQPSGETVEVRQSGDEHVHYFQTKTGELVGKGEDEYWYYLTVAEGEFVLTEKKVGIDSIPENVGREADAQQIRKDLLAQPQSRSVSTVTPKKYDQPQEIPLLVLLIEFSDEKLTYTDADWQTRFFSKNEKSVVDYYDKATKGKMNFVPAKESVGTENDGIVRVTIDREYPKSVGTILGKENLSQYREVIRTAVGQVAQNLSVAAYDKNENQFLDPSELTVVTVFAGGEASYMGDTQGAVWAHNRTFPMQAKESVEVSQGSGTNYISNVTVIGEKHGNHQATIGVMCHEMGHAHGLGDLYDTEPIGKEIGIGPYSVMALGSWGYIPGEERGTTPVYFDAYSKMVLGVLTPVVNTHEEHQELTLSNAATGSENSWKVRSKKSSEYYLMENRQFTGYDQGLRSSVLFPGVAVYHVNAGHLENINTTGRLLTLKEADESLVGSNLDNGIMTSLNSLYYKGKNNLGLDQMTELSPTTVPSTMFIKYAGGSSPLPYNIKVLDPAGPTMRVAITQNSDAFIPIQTLKIKEGPSTVALNSSLKLDASIEPENATYQDKTWTSSDPSIASIDEKGKVTAKKEGSVTMTVSSGGIKDSVQLTVVAIPITVLTITPINWLVKMEETPTLKVTITPENTTDKEVTWTSSDPSVATIDKAGKITPKKEGKVTITVSAGKVKDEIALTVGVAKPIREYFKDEELAKEVARSLNREVTKSVYPNFFDALTTLSFPSNKKLGSLEGIGHLKELRYLKLWYTDLSLVDMAQLQQSEKLTRLDFNGKGISSLQFLKKLPLKEVYIGDCIDLLEIDLPAHKTLEKIDLSGITSVQVLSNEAWGEMPNLKSVGITKSNKFESLTFTNKYALEELMITSYQAESLKIEGQDSLRKLVVKVKDGQFDSNMARFPNLEYLELRGESFTPVTNLSKVPHLRTLDIWGDILKWPQDEIKTLSELETLRVRKNKEVHGVQFVYGLEKLRTLDLSLNKNLNSTNGYHGSSLSELKQLTSLTIDDTWFHDMGMDEKRMLAFFKGEKLLEKNQLTELSLQDQLLTDKGVNQIVSNLPMLQKVVLDGNKLTEVQFINDLVYLTHFSAKSNQVLSIEEVSDVLSKLDDWAMNFQEKRIALVTDSPTVQVPIEKVRGLFGQEFVPQDLSEGGSYDDVNQTIEWTNLLVGKPQIKFYRYTGDSYLDNFSGTIYYDITYLESVSEVKVTYCDEAGTALLPPETIKGATNTPYTITVPTIPGFEFKESQGALEGQFQETPQTVQLVYKEDMGTLDFEKVSGIQFGKIKLNEQQATQAYGQVMDHSLGNGQKLSSAFTIKLSDTRKEEAGWHLLVKQTVPWKTKEGDSLFGAELTLANVHPSPYGSPINPQAPTGTPSTPVVITDETSEVLAASSEEGKGTWVIGFGQDNTPEESLSTEKAVALTLPVNLPVVKNQVYQTVLVWTLSAVP